jgi:hypothetical protein
MLPTVELAPESRYLAPLIGLKELAVVGEDFTDYGNRRTSIQKRSHLARWRGFKADTASLNNVT